MDPKIRNVSLDVAQAIGRVRSSSGMEMPTEFYGAILLRGGFSPDRPTVLGVPVTAPEGGRRSMLRSVVGRTGGDAGLFICEVWQSPLPTPEEDPDRTEAMIVSINVVGECEIWLAPIADGKVGDFTLVNPGGCQGSDLYLMLDYDPKRDVPPPVTHVPADA